MGDHFDISHIFFPDFRPWMSLWFSLHLTQPTGHVLQCDWQAVAAAGQCCAEAIWCQTHTLLLREYCAHVLVLFYLTFSVSQLAELGVCHLSPTSSLTRVLKQRSAGSLVCKCRGEQIVSPVKIPHIPGGRFTTRRFRKYWCVSLSGNPRQQVGKCRWVEEVDGCFWQGHRNG